MLFFYNGDSIKPGIYEIRNRFSNRSYIGQTVRVKRRWQGHKKTLSAGCKTNQFLLADYRKCKELLGHDDFLEFHVVETLEGVPKEDRLQREEYWIERAVEEYGKQSVYNFNHKPTTERLFSSPKGKRRRSSSQYRRGRNHPYYGKSSPMKGKTHPEEIRKAIGKASCGRALSNEAKEKIRVANLGKKASSEAKEKMRVAQAGKKQSAETVEKRRQKMLGANHPGWVGDIDKDWLFEQYISLRRTTHEIAKMLSIDVSTVCERLRKHNIPIRNASESRKGRSKRFFISKEELATLVWEIPIVQIAKNYGVSDFAVRSRCRQEGIATPNRGYWNGKTGEA